MALAPEHDGTDGTKRKDHYGSGKQPWDTIKEMGWAAPFAAANVLKYLRRSKDPEHSLESARWYYARLDDMSSHDYAGTIKHNLLMELTSEEHNRLFGNAVP